MSLVLTRSVVRLFVGIISSCWRTEVFWASSLNYPLLLNKLYLDFIRNRISMPHVPCNERTNRSNKVQSVFYSYTEEPCMAKSTLLMFGSFMQNPDFQQRHERLEKILPLQEEQKARQSKKKKKNPKLFQFFQDWHLAYFFFSPTLPQAWEKHLLSAKPHIHQRNNIFKIHPGNTTVWITQNLEVSERLPM